MRFETIDELRIDPAAALFYAEGWQSWSPTAWTRWGTQQRPDEPWQHEMRFRPDKPLPDGQAVQGEGLLVVDPGTGAPARAYGVDHMADDVATIRAEVSDGRLLVSSDGPVVVGAHDDGLSALAAFGTAFAARAGVRFCARSGLA